MLNKQLEIPQIKKNVTAALDYFKSDNIDILFIDSSHQYEHTLKELNLWFDIIKKVGSFFFTRYK